MQSEHLKPDEIAMKERAEKATKGPWGLDGDPRAGMEGNVFVNCAPGVTVCFPAIDPDDDEWSQHNMDFIAAARTDLPTILARLANERAKLAIDAALFRKVLTAIDGIVWMDALAIELRARINEAEKERDEQQELQANLTEHFIAEARAALTRPTGQAIMDELSAARKVCEDVTDVLRETQGDFMPHVRESMRVYDAARKANTGAK